MRQHRNGAHVPREVTTHESFAGTCFSCSQAVSAFVAFGFPSCAATGPAAGHLPSVLVAP